MLRDAYANAAFAYFSDAPAYAPVPPAEALAWLAANGGADAHQVTGYLDSRQDPFGDGRATTLWQFQVTDAVAATLEEGKSLVFGTTIYGIKSIPRTNTGVQRIDLTRRQGPTL